MLSRALLFERGARRFRRQCLQPLVNDSQPVTRLLLPTLSLRLALIELGEGLIDALPAAQELRLDEPLPLALYTVELPLCGRRLGAKPSSVCAGRAGGALLSRSSFAARRGGAGRLSARRASLIDEREQRSCVPAGGCGALLK